MPALTHCLAESIDMHNQAKEDGKPFSDLVAIVTLRAQMMGEIALGSDPDAKSKPKAIAAPIKKPVKKLVKKTVKKPVKKTRTKK